MAGSGQNSRTYIALAADHLVAVVLAGQSLEGGFDNTTAEAEDEMKGGFLYDHPIPSQNSLVKSE